MRLLKYILTGLLVVVVMVAIVSLMGMPKPYNYLLTFFGGFVNGYVLAFMYLTRGAKLIAQNKEEWVG